MYLGAPAKRRGDRLRPFGCRALCFAALFIFALLLSFPITRLWAIGSDHSDLGNTAFAAPRSSNDRFKLASGALMPVMGLGMAALRNSDEVLRTALRVGYRLFDTASQHAVWYRNELTLGNILRATDSSLPPRSSLFITTKLLPADHGEVAAKEAIEESCRNLNCPLPGDSGATGNAAPIDLYLIHFPYCWGDLCKHAANAVGLSPRRRSREQPEGSWQGSWKAMTDAVNRGLIRSIGVSNFDLTSLQELAALAAGSVPISVVQAWMDPWHQTTDVRRWCTSHGVVFQAYSLLGSQWIARGAIPSGQNPLTLSATIRRIAARHGVTPGEVVLAWALRLRVAVIPRSNSEAHLIANLNAFNVTLSAIEMADIAELDGTNPARGL